MFQSTDAKLSQVALAIQTPDPSLQLKFNILRRSFRSNFFSVLAYFLFSLSSIQYTIEPILNEMFSLPFKLLGLFHLCSLFCLFVGIFLHSEYIENQIAESNRLIFISIREFFGVANILIGMLIQSISLFARTHSNACSTTISDFSKTFCNSSGDSGTLTLDSLYMSLIFAFISLRVFDYVRWEYKFFCLLYLLISIIGISFSSQTMRSPTLGHVTLVFFAPFFELVYFYSQESKKMEQLLIWLKLHENEDYVNTSLLQASLGINIDWYLSICSAKQTKKHLKVVVSRQVDEEKSLKLHRRQHTHKRSFKHQPEQQSAQQQQRNKQKIEMRSRRFLPHEHSQQQQQQQSTQSLTRLTDASPPASLSPPPPPTTTLLPHPSSDHYLESENPSSSPPPPLSSLSQPPSSSPSSLLSGGGAAQLTLPLPPIPHSLSLPYKTSHSYSLVSVHPSPSSPPSTESPSFSFGFNSPKCPSPYSPYPYPHPSQSQSPPSSYLHGSPPPPLPPPLPPTQASSMFPRISSSSSSSSLPYYPFSSVPTSPSQYQSNHMTPSSSFHPSFPSSPTTQQQSPPSTSSSFSPFKSTSSPSQSPSPSSSLTMSNEF